MKAIKTERIVKAYYDALEEGRVLGRKCPKCGHIEFPPYLACNECGNLDTEWVDLSNTRAHVDQILRPLVIFPETEFREANGGYMPAAVRIDHADPIDTSIVHVDADRYEELHDHLENVTVKPCIVQGEDTKICVWTLEDYEGESGVSEKTMSEEAAPAGSGGEIDEIAGVVIGCAAEAYEADAGEITMDTDVREDLSNQSIRLIILLSNIEDALHITIEIAEAGTLQTIGDFVNAAKEKLRK